MKEIAIDISQMCGMDEIHQYLKEKFQFPDYYGANLDALYDMLTDIGEDTSVTMVFSKVQEAAGYVQGKRIRWVFLEAARENSHLRLIDGASEIGKK